MSKLLTNVIREVLLLNILNRYTTRWKLDVFRLLCIFALIPLLWGMYGGMIKHTIFLYKDPLEDMSHGWVIPFISGFLLLRQRRLFSVAAGKPSLVGLLWVIPCLLIFWFGAGGSQTRLEQISLVGLLWSITYAFWGRDVAKLAMFPIGFLVFTIPMSSIFDSLTVHLRILSSSFACVLMNGFGLEIQRSGTALFSTISGCEFNVDVAAPCSGIRSVFALMALTAVYAYYSQKTLLQKGLLFLMSVPLAVMGNMVRILSICIVAVMGGQELATGFYHDYSGYIVFLIAIILMNQFGGLIAKLSPWIKRQHWLPEFLCDEFTLPARQESHYSGRDFVIPLLSMIFVSSLAAYKVFKPNPFYDDTLFVTRNLPAMVTGFDSDVPLYCHNPQCLSNQVLKQDTNIDVKELQLCSSCNKPLFAMSFWESELLPQDTDIIKRNYRSSDGMMYSMNVVIGGRSRASIHRAELCLPGQGFNIQRSENIILNLESGESVTARLIHAQQPGGRRVALLYWLISRKHTCSSHAGRILYDVWDRSIHNEINRWVMFSVFIPSGLDSAESIERFEEFLSEFYPQVLLKAKSVKD
ncbi:MAG: exosortase/archaeosortase family protein [Kiritimatiellia bacterium]